MKYIKKIISNYFRFKEGYILDLIRKDIYFI